MTVSADHAVIYVCDGVLAIVACDRVIKAVERELAHALDRVDQRNRRA